MTRSPDTRPVSFLVERNLRQMEARYDYSFDYVRHIWHTSRAAFRRFSFGFMWFAKGRDTLPADATAVAGIVSTMHADCGPCTQITVNMALEAKVDPKILEHAVSGNIAALPPQLALIHRFASAIVAGDYHASALRDEVVEIYGEKGLVDIATTIATGQVYPMLKRTLGFGETCLKVRIGSNDVAAHRVPAHAA